MPLFELDDAQQASIPIVPESTPQLDATADQIVNEIPEPQQHAIDQATREAAADPSSPTATVETDALGIPWDPAEHATGADGKGVRTAKGAWRKRRGLKGSASHAAIGAAGRVPPAETEEQVNARTHEQQCRMAGAVTGTFVMRVSVAVGGDSFHSRTHQIPGGGSYTDLEMLQGAFGDYYLAKGIVDVPPGVALCGALMMYYLPRFQEPEVRKKAGGFLHWCKEKGERVYVWFKYRKSGGKKPNGSAGAPEVVERVPGINPDV